MNRHHGASTLPVELVSLIFDSLSLAELLEASHVSKYWRTIACRHPTFWRDITLAAASSTAMNFFHARLEAGSSRTVSVRIYVSSLEFPAEKLALVLRTITRNLYRIDGLYLELNIAADSDMFSALQQPAPHLRILDLCLVDDVRTSDLLPADLFTSQAPNLRYVRLANIQLRADRLPHVFAPITQLHYCFGETLSFPTALFTHSRALEMLVIYGPCCSLEAAEDEQCTLTTERLKHVDVSVFKGSSDLMQRLPCASIPDISLPINDKQSAQLLLSHLRRPLEVHMDLEPNADHLRLRYRSPGTAMQRTFLCAPEQVAEAYLPSVYVSSELLSRVETLHASASAAGLLPAFCGLDACTRVDLSLADGARLTPPQRPLRAPKIEHVAISSATPQTLPVGQLVDFLGAMLLPGSKAVQVALTGVALDGDLTAIPRDRFVLAGHDWLDAPRPTT
ncbi:hypothetical protein AURDEDRAFT_163423 [Auricularia subglabra TFB-10046 SS5]|nr:hypothetical protein AURDEDRAFT_163423 [Auricularia subglabra TFB-10046 SS5]